MSGISSEFMEEYNLRTFAHVGWVYFEIVRRFYGLPQSGKAAKNLMRTRINNSGYFVAATTPGIFRHTWSTIQFCLIIDDFGIEYVRGKHAHHLRQVPKEYYELSEDWKGTKFAGIALECNYAANHNERTCRLNIKGYSEIVIIRFDQKIQTWID